MSRFVHSLYIQSVSKSQIIVKTVSSKNFSLTESEFQDLCYKLQNGDEGFLEKLYMTHFKDCQAYLKSSLNTTEDESYDATMNTLVLFRKRLLLGKVSYGNLRFLFTQMAYYEIIKIRKKKEANYKNEKERVRYIETAEGSDEERKKKLIAAISNLNEDQKQLLHDHFYKKMKLSQIAEISGVPQSTIRKRKERMLIKLKECVAKPLLIKANKWSTTNKNISNLR